MPLASTRRTTLLILAGQPGKLQGMAEKRNWRRDRADEVDFLALAKHGVSPFGRGLFDCTQSNPLLLSDHRGDLLDGLGPLDGHMTKQRLFRNQRLVGDGMRRKCARRHFMNWLHPRATLSAASARPIKVMSSCTRHVITVSDNDPGNSWRSPARPGSPPASVPTVPARTAASASGPRGDLRLGLRSAIVEEVAKRHRGASYPAVQRHPQNRPVGRGNARLAVGPDRRRGLS